MNYIDENGASYELPKLTVSLSEEIAEGSDRSKPVRQRAEAQLSVCVKCVGSKAVARLCDGKSLETVDVSKLDALFRGVKAAYEAPAAEAALESAKVQLDALAPLLEAYKAVSELPSKPSRQGFSRVR